MNKNRKINNPNKLHLTSSKTSFFQFSENVINKIKKLNNNFF